MNLKRQERSFIDVAIQAATQDPHKLAYSMLSDDGEPVGSLSFADLDRRARALGAYLAQRYAPGQRAVLLYPAGLDYVVAFYACLYSGVIAVPAYPPRVNRNLSRLVSVVDDSLPAIVLTETGTLATRATLLELSERLRAVEWLPTNELELDESADWSPVAATPETTAFLQYTSGSTAAPKGVIVSHGNLLRNEELIRRSFTLSDETVVVSWLPMYHDMGLIGNILAAVYNRASCHLMSPAAFLRRPLTWLEAVSRVGATASGGPNFAFDVCTAKVRDEDLGGLDLSGWRVAFNGSEPIRAATLRRFAEKFASCGFRYEAFAPCYGMAETTLFVSGAAPSEKPCTETLDKEALKHRRAVAPERPDAGEEYVSSGRVQVDEVVIVEPQTRRLCTASEVGEIWVADESVAGGYWRKPAVTAESFEARVAGSAKGPYLRTGDLGVLRNGELFVLGRIKDLIIIRGRNHYPQDIEASAEAAHPALRDGSTVAFSIERDGEERLAIVAEVTREARRRVDIDEVGEAVYSAVANDHGVAAHEVVLIQPATSRKTSSGKPQRSATRRDFLEGDLDVVAAWRNVIPDEALIEASFAEDRPLDRGELERWLASEVAARLNVTAERLDPHRPIAEYGLDSLAAVELLAAVEDKIGCSFPFENLFVGEPSLRSLAEMLFDLLPEPEPATAAAGAVRFEEVAFAGVEGVKVSR